MRYTVVWAESAEAELAQIWTSAANRQAVRAAADGIDASLRFRPMDVGESREDVFRVLLVPPVGVFYSVIEEDSMVVVVRVWRTSSEGDANSL
jgi:plasmid stabilization system protein ParE